MKICKTEGERAILYPELSKRGRAVALWNVNWEEVIGQGKAV